jgi:HEAT repeat protein
MKSGLEKTFLYLKKTENEAAVEVLGQALDYDSSSVRKLALQALLERRSPAGHRAVFNRLTKLEEFRAIISERPERLVRAVRESLKTADKASSVAAFKTILEFRLYEALPAMVSVTKDPASPHFEIAKKTILALTEKLYTELSGDKLHRADAIRANVTASLEEAIGKFNTHQSSEIVESFILVTKQQNAFLRRMLRQQSDTVHHAMVDILSNSQRGGVIRVLLGFLEDHQMPIVVKNIITSRTDMKFVKNLLEHVGPSPSRAVSQTLSMLDSIAWARPGHETLMELDETCQFNAVRLLVASRIPREEVLEMLGFLLAEGNAGGRRASAEALGKFTEPQATAMIVRALNDEDPQVRAHLLRQLRPRKIPGSLSLLMRMVGNAHEVVREALKESLPEFTFRQFILNFDVLPEELRATTGHLVQKIDADAEPALLAEMNCPSPVRRRRAVLASVAMGLTRKMEQMVIGLLSDDDHMVRIAAAKSLAEVDTMPSWGALRDALLDRSVIVKETAEESLRKISQSLLTDHEDEENAEENAEQEMAR